MRRNKKILPVFLIILIASLFLFFRKKDKLQTSDIKEISSQSQSNLSSESLNEETKVKEAASLSKTDKRNIDTIRSIFSADISFWGKVVDEKGSPVEAADITFSAADKYFKDGSKYHSKSDSQGLFSITGIKGAGVNVFVRKEGYYFFDKSDGAFGYSVPTGEKPPSRENPAIFILKKKGNAELLIKKYVNIGGSKLSRKGETVEYKFSTGELVEKGKGDIRITTKIDDIPRFNGPQTFDWSVKLEIPKGGFLDRKDQFDFVAPESGYESKWDIQKLTSVSGGWRPSVSRDIFIKFGNGQYARANLRIDTFSEIINPDGSGYKTLSVSGDIYLNPSGSRNLEYDPAKRIK